MRGIIFPQKMRLIKVSYVMSEVSMTGYMSKQITQKPFRSVGAVMMAESNNYMHHHFL